MNIHQVHIFNSGDVRRLVLGASNTVGIYVLPKFLGDFKELYPKVEIALNIQNRQEAVEQSWQASSILPLCRIRQSPPTFRLNSS